MADLRNIGGEASIRSGMFPANSHTIRPATARDAIALRRLAAASGVRPLTGRILVAERGHVVIAALSLSENRTIADSDLAPSYVATPLRLRADGIEAYERQPRLSVVVVRFGEQYRQWNAAFDAGYAAALGKPLITLHPAEHDHALKEVDRAALAVAREPEQVVEILRYVLAGPIASS
jgi:hypothetical protein